MMKRKIFLMSIALIGFQLFAADNGQGVTERYLYLADARHFGCDLTQRSRTEPVRAGLVDKRRAVQKEAGITSVVYNKVACSTCNAGEYCKVAEDIKNLRVNVALPVQ